MTTSGPEPTEERRPTSDSDSWRALALDVLTNAGRETTSRWLHDARYRRDALLAAEPEHLPGSQPDSAD